MNTIFLAALIFFSCGGSGAGEESIQEGYITISGQVGFPNQKGEIVLEKITQDNQYIPIDTFQLKEDYSYSGSVEIPNPGFYRMNFFNLQQVNLILDDDDIEVNVDGNDPQGFVEIRGSKDHDFIQFVQNTMSTMQTSERMKQINESFIQARQAGDEALMRAMQEEFIQYDDSVKNTIIDSIRTLGPSLGAIEVMRTNRVLNKDKHYEFFVEYAADVKSEMAASPEAMSFVDQVDSWKFLSVGAEAPEIALPNPDGDTVKLSSWRGNYVLLDFWAKWCKPCRVENPNVVRLYNKYNDKGFEVYGVSLDRTRADWLQAIEEDGLTWTHVSDLKFWNSAAAQTYSINAIPFALLLDPEGKIIGKNLRGVALEKKLAEIFGE